MSEEAKKLKAIRKECCDKAMECLLNMDSITHSLRAAYNRGWDDGKKYAMEDAAELYDQEYEAWKTVPMHVKEADASYRVGLKDAWEAAKFIVGSVQKGRNSIDVNEAFGEIDSRKIINQWAPDEAIRKIKAWESMKSKPHWEYNSETGNVECSECGEKAMTAIDSKWIKSPYCPHCGVKMGNGTGEKAKRWEPDVIYRPSVESSGTANQEPRFITTMPKLVVTL